jgi:CheY-like chemotaxis protein
MKKNILVVDDDADILEQVAAVLTGAGHKVITAQGEAQADERLTEVRPDLAIVDVMMEQQDSGFMLSHRIKRLYPGTPVILLTSVTSVTGCEFPLAAGGDKPWVKADRLLQKPVRPEVLRAEVRGLLEAAKAKA